MRELKSVAYYLLHNMLDKSYMRVLRASLKYPNAFLYELQHGINSIASQEFRLRHALKIFCYRDYLGEDRFSYYGVNLYFIEREEKDYFEDIQDHFVDELEHNLGMDYERSGLSECSVDDVGTVKEEETGEADFVFEISDLKRQKFAYWGHWHENKFIELNLFGGFNLGALERMLLRR